MKIEFGITGDAEDAVIRAAEGSEEKASKILQVMFEALLTSITSVQSGGQTITLDARDAHAAIAKGALGLIPSAEAVVFITLDAASISICAECREPDRFAEDGILRILEGATRVMLESSMKCTMPGSSTSQ